MNFQATVLLGIITQGYKVVPINVPSSMKFRGTREISQSS